MTEEELNSSPTSVGPVSHYNAVMGLGILCDDEELAGDFVSTLTTVFDRVARELVSQPQYVGKVTLLTPKEGDAGDS